MNDKHQKILDLIAAYKEAAEQEIITLSRLQQAQTAHYQAAVKTARARIAAEEAVKELQEAE